MNNSYLKAFIKHAIKEDVGSGDHSTLACIPKNKKEKAKLFVKSKNAIIAGVDISTYIFKYLDKSIKIKTFKKDGDEVKEGDIIFTIEGRVHPILMAERLVLNTMQRMSGVATYTREYVNKIADLPTKIIDTRKTCPGMRHLQKAAVKIGGGTNHRMGLYDMIMLKDNHIDFAGGIEQAILKTREYLRKKRLAQQVIIEARSLNDVDEILRVGHVNRILLDNFSIEETKQAVKKINGQYETESSGGINIETVREYALCGVDFISIGAITHQTKSIDLSIQAFQVE